MASSKSVTTPYTGAKRLINPTDIPSWINEYDAARLASYQLYENIYWTEPNTFKLSQRGKDENPIYIPSGRVIVNTMDRYVAPDFAPMVDSDFGEAPAQAEALRFYTDFFKRERLGSQYEGNKLYGIMRGDWCWYITANPLKPAGSRLTLRSIDPALVFPINDPEDVDRIEGYDLIEQKTVGDTLYVQRTRYLKSESLLHPSGGGTPGGPISYEVILLETEKWEDPDEMKVFRVDQAPVLLPTDITTLPVYHIKNFEEPGNPFGSSEMRGIERLMAAVNQTITDEELSLALEGLGMYKSGKGQPQDANHNPIPWQLGPGKVVHDDTFERVNGVNTVGPFQEHLKYLHDRMDRVSGASDVAQGVVDVTVAESGIALALRMGPILGSAKKKDKSIEEVMDNMLYDLPKWIKAYEGLDFTTTRIVSSYGQKMPLDAKARFDQLMQMYSAQPPLITGAYFRDACREMGITIPLDVDGAAVVEEQKAIQDVLDPYNARMDAEIQAAEAAAAGAPADTSA